MKHIKTEADLEKVLPEALAKIEQDRQKANNPEIQQKLLNRLSDPNPDMRYSAVLYLGLVSKYPHIQDALLKMFQDPDPEIQVAAVNALSSHIREENIRKGMIRLLKDNNPLVSESTADILENYVEDYFEIREALKQKDAKEIGANTPPLEKPMPSEPTLTQSLPRVGRTRRQWIKTLAGAGVTAVLGAGAVAIYQAVKSTSPKEDILLVSNDFVSDHEKSRKAMQNLPFIKHRAPDSVLIGRDASPTFVQSHNDPLEYQWLLHYAKTTRLVASARKNQNLIYLFKRFNNDWEDDSRTEFLIIVTANKVLPGWPTDISSPIDITDLFNQQDWEMMKSAVYEEETFEQSVEPLKRIIRSALDRKFGSNTCWFEVFQYTLQK